MKRQPSPISLSRFYMIAEKPCADPFSFALPPNEAGQSQWVFMKRTGRVSPLKEATKPNHMEGEPIRFTDLPRRCRATVRAILRGQSVPVYAFKSRNRWGHFTDTESRFNAVLTELDRDGLPLVTV